jgi:hypothetical protein
VCSNPPITPHPVGRGKGAFEAPAPSNAEEREARAALAAVLRAWSAAIGIGKTRTMDQVIETASSDRGLKAALVAVAAMDDGQTVSNVRLDRWLRSVNEVEVNQLILRGGGVDDGSVKWTLTLPVEPHKGSPSL